MCLDCFLYLCTPKTIKDKIYDFNSYKNVAGKQQNHLCCTTFYFDFLSVFRLYSGVGGMVGMGDSSGCFVSWTYFCVDFKLFKIDRNTAYLISSGTAICGGSAIAAVGPVLRAKDSEMSVALGTIFILNAIALFIFPMIGHALSMDQQQFGTWAAIAIHDTSSVVGAGAAYGEEALKVATTIKLTRALWIIPMAFATSFIFKSKGQKISIPWFIFFFVLAMVVNTYLLDGVPQLGAAINGIARKTLTITMFFIGASLSLDVLKAVGIKPLLQGVLLWVVISLSTLAYIYFV